MRARVAVAAVLSGACLAQVQSRGKYRRTDPEQRRATAAAGPGHVSAQREDNDMWVPGPLGADATLTLPRIDNNALLVEEQARECSATGDCPPGVFASRLGSGPPDNDASKKGRDAHGGYRVGKAVDVALDACAGDGQWTTNTWLGVRVWRARISSPGATFLSLRFSRLRLPPGSELYVLDGVGTAVLLGAFTGAVNNKEDGRFATAPVCTDAIVLEYWEPLPPKPLFSLPPLIAHAGTNMSAQISSLNGFSNPAIPKESLGVGITNGEGEGEIQTLAAQEESTLDHAMDMRHKAQLESKLNLATSRRNKCNGAALELEAVVHGFRVLPPGERCGARVSPEHAVRPYASAGCHIDVACPEGDRIRDQIRSVAFVMIGRGERICTGAMLNTARADGRQVLLSARHCMREGEDAENVLVLFNYERARCVPDLLTDEEAPADLDAGLKRRRWYPLNRGGAGDALSKMHSLAVGTAKSAPLDQESSTDATQRNTSSAMQTAACHMDQDHSTIARQSNWSSTMQTDAPHMDKGSGTDASQSRSMAGEESDASRMDGNRNAIVNQWNFLTAVETDALDIQKERSGALSQANSPRYTRTRDYLGDNAYLDEHGAPYADPYRHDDAHACRVVPYDAAHGVRVLASSASSDVVVGEVLEALPRSYGVYRAGWSRAVSPPPADVATVHHPRGDYKKLSFYTGSAELVAWDEGGAGARLFWKVPHWTGGETEGGSSGAPLFDGAGRVVGTLKGGYSSCVRRRHWDRYGALCGCWDVLGPVLDPDETGVVFVDGAYL